MTRQIFSTAPDLYKPLPGCILTSQDNNTDVVTTKTLKIRRFHFFVYESKKRLLLYMNLKLIYFRCILWPVVWVYTHMEL